MYSARPDSDNLVFLKYFPDPFQGAERDTNKRNNKQILHEHVKNYPLFYTHFIYLFSWEWCSFSVETGEEDLRNKKAMESGLILHVYKHFKTKHNLQDSIICYPIYYITCSSIIYIRKVCTTFTIGLFTLIAGMWHFPVKTEQSWSNPQNDFFQRHNEILKEWNMFQIFSCHLIRICF